MDSTINWWMVSYHVRVVIMFKVIEWITLNWKVITIFLGFIFLFSMIKPLADMLRGVKEGVREIFTPVGFLVLVVLILFGIWLFTQFKGLW